jgi:hypothetical protein
MKNSIKFLVRVGILIAIVCCVIFAIAGISHLIQNGMSEKTFNNLMYTIGFVFVGGWVLACLFFLIWFIIDDTELLYKPENKVLRALLALIPLTICVGFTIFAMTVLPPKEGIQTVQLILLVLADLSFGTIFCVLLWGILNLIFSIIHWLISGKFIGVATYINIKWIEEYEKRRGLNE